MNQNIKLDLAEVEYQDPITLQDIKESTWEKDIVKVSLINFIHEMPQDKNSWWKLSFISSIVFALSYNGVLWLADSSYIEFGSWVHKGLMALIAVLTGYFFMRGQRFILRRQEIEERIFAKETKPIHKTKALKTSNRVFSVVFGIVVAAAVYFMGTKAGINNVVHLLCLPYLVLLQSYYFFRDFYKVRYIKRHLLYFVKNIEFKLDLKEKDNN